MIYEEEENSFTFVRMPREMYQTHEEYFILKRLLDEKVPMLVEWKLTVPKETYAKEIILFKQLQED